MRRRVLKNICANWLGIIVSALLGFVMTPIILRNLGAAGFGLYVLMASFVDYYGLFDLGIRNAVLRYVSRYSAVQDHDSLSRVASTSLFTYSLTGLTVALVTAAISWKFHALFSVSSGLENSARMVVMIFGLGAALKFPLTLFTAILEAQQQFTWVSITQSVAVVIRSFFILLAFRHGYGLVGVSIITVVMTLSACVVHILVAFKVCPQMRLRWALVERATFGTLSKFGVVTFWIGIAQRLRFQTDSIVIASFLSLPSVSMFAVSSKIVNYATEFVQALATVFTPVFSHYDALNDRAALRHVLVQSNRYSALVAFPATVVLLLSGRSMLRVWVGPEYLDSYSVLVILAIPTALYLAQAGSTKVLYGMARHQTLARVLFAEGVANLALSILLLRWFDIDGVALGTAIPLALTSLVFLPIHVPRQIEMKISDYVRESFLLPMLPSLPLAIALWLLERWVRPHSYPSLLLEFAGAGAVYAIAFLGFVYWKDWPARRKQPGAARAAERAAGA